MTIVGNIIRNCHDCKHHRKIREKIKSRKKLSGKVIDTYITEHDYVHCDKVKKILSKSKDTGKSVRVNKWFAHVCPLFEPIKRD